MTHLSYVTLTKNINERHLFTQITKPAERTENHVDVMANNHTLATRRIRILQQHKRKIIIQP